MKREKAKQRTRTKMDQMDQPFLVKIEPSMVSEDVENVDCEGKDKNKKKILQMIRNRISAQNSRDRKKAYLYQLEESKHKLYSDTFQLTQEKNILLNELARLREANEQITAENEELKNGSKFLCNKCNNSDNKSQQQPLEEMVQSFINSSDPTTSDLLNKNKGLLANTFTFSVFLSTILLNRLNQQKGLVTAGIA